MDDWAVIGNVRQMHSPFLPPAGKGILVDHQPDGVYVTSKIFEPGAMKQVRNGGYAAYSVGLSKVRKTRDAGAPNGRIIGGQVVELSLVDRGANPTCKIEVAKSAGYQPDGAFMFLGGADEATLAAYAERIKADAPDNLPESTGPDESTAHSRPGIQEHSKPHTAESGHSHQHDKSDKFIDAGESHSHDHTHPSDDGGHDSHMGTHAGIFGDASKTEVPQGIGRMDPTTAFAQVAATTPKANGPKGNQQETPPSGSGNDDDPEDKGDGKGDDDPPMEKVVTPTVTKNGMAAAMGPTARNLVYQMLQQEITEDGGTGSQAMDIGHLGKSYCALNEFLGSEAAESDLLGSIMAAGVPNSLKMLHDLSCASVPLDAAKAEWPDLSRGFAQAFAGPRQTLLQMLQASLGESAVKGSGDLLGRLSDLYARVAGLTPARDPGQAELNLLTAVGEVRKLGNGVDMLEFHAASGPRFGTPPGPGQFDRGFLSAGHASDTAGSAPHMPPDPKPLDASQFDRGIITAGHERDTPGNSQAQVQKADAPDSPTAVQNNENGDAATGAGRRYYTNAAKDNVTQSLRQIHDQLVALHPDICGTLDAAAKAAITAGVGTMAGAGSLRVVSDASLPPTSVAGAVKLDTAEVTKVAQADAGAVQPDMMKAFMAEITGLRAELAAAKSEQAETRALLERVASAPDPGATPFRGMQGMGGIVVAEKTSQVAEAQKRARYEELTQRVRGISSHLRTGGNDPGGALALKLEEYKQELGWD